MGIFKKQEPMIPVVCNLDIQRYLGNWYEIGRLPMRSEKNLDYITAIYNLKKNGKIEVVNSGYKKGKLKSVRGTAWAPNERCMGSLLVSFFKPFKSEYNVIMLEENYQYAVVMGDTRDRMWILSRTPEMEDKIYDMIIKFLDKNGFDTKKIINAKQDRGGIIK